MTASDLVHELAGAAQQGTVDAFRVTLHAASLLIIEDIEFLSDRRLAQRELLRLLDAIDDETLVLSSKSPKESNENPVPKSASAPMRRRSRGVLLTAAIPPGEWTGFHPMLVSRILGGLTIPLTAPGEVVRRALISSWALTAGVALNDDAVELLAGRTNGVVPVVRGHVLSVFQELKAATSEQPLNRNRETNPEADRDRFAASDVSVILDRLDREREHPTVHEIAKATARYFGVRLPELRGKSRMTRIAMARHCAIALAEGLCGRSLCEIGRYFSGRNHTTMAHSCRRVREMIDSEPEIRDAMRTLRANFER